MSTETVDPRYIDLDSWPSEYAVDAMLEGQMAAVAAAASQSSQIAAASIAAADRLLEGRRLVYVGAGTSGRIAVQDGVELTPTYNWPAERLAFMMAGGMTALAASVEGAEDDVERAIQEVAELEIGHQDVVIGVAASGRTPYTIAAINAARKAGALTISIANNAGSALLEAAEHPILAATGSETVAGSTRMKAGTAQKVVLNTLSTAIMLRLGLVCRGLMVNMRVSNVKLHQRAISMVGRLAKVDHAKAEEALLVADNDIRKAVLIAMNQSKDKAEKWLSIYKGNLRQAMDALALSSENQEVL
ncbi:MAG: N-acetylmuramic acid 6-phosphate etherase [Zymomonas mobilis]|uniref:N-acetylmuramic acid 6-phosphate etherase n=1 Tax=Zymomonas mobilis TaxID=542 RepID=A0A542W234_ZYMMB|nr:N-acetylmuramic acid 6-phosphate etherase [Zymomonas mobilis]TQL17647.1 N-acetylmuramic acid 6-phosphate etherase [Zymomonas mobilis]